MSPQDWTPDTRQRIQKAQRFFARILSFDLECPHCGEVYSIRYGQQRKVGGKGKYRGGRDANWDPWTSRFTCTNKDCGKVYVLGILSWPIISAPSVASATPKDQVPNARQVAQMRKEGGGWWMPDEEGQRYPQPHETNLTLEEDRPDAEDDDED